MSRIFSLRNLLIFIAFFTLFLLKINHFQEISFNDGINIFKRTKILKSIIHIKKERIIGLKMIEGKLTEILIILTTLYQKNLINLNFF